jgi:hypothetical protein
MLTLQIAAGKPLPQRDPNSECKRGYSLVHLFSASKRDIMVNSCMNGIRLPAQVSELLRVKGLGAVAQGLLGLVVDFDHQAVGAHSRGGPA